MDMLISPTRTPSGNAHLTDEPPNGGSYGYSRQPYVFDKPASERHRDILVLATEAGACPMASLRQPTADHIYPMRTCSSDSHSAGQLTTGHLAILACHSSSHIEHSKSHLATQIHVSKWALPAPNDHERIVEVIGLVILVLPHQTHPPRTL